MKKLIYTLSIIAGLLIVHSCGQDTEKTASIPESGVTVEIRQVSEGDLNPFLSASGTVQAVNSADLSTRVMGYVEAVKVDIGQQVQKGKLLISINDIDIQAKKARVEAGIVEAETAFKNAKRDYERFQNLFLENSVSQKEMDDVTANYEMAEARLESARQMMTEVNAQMAYTQIKAPFTGTITAKFVKQGDMANPGQPLISIEGQGGLEVAALIPESEIGRIKKQGEVKVRIKSVNHDLKGKVSELSSSSRNTGGQYMVKIEIEDTNENVLPGMYATVQFPVAFSGSIQNITVPREALVERGQLTGIYTVSKTNTAILRWIRTGRDYGDMVEVLSGLSPGEAYIIPGETRLYNGIRINNPKN